jgi:hypothetical protein
MTHFQFQNYYNEEENCSMLMDGDHVRIWKKAVSVCLKIPVCSSFLLRILRKTSQ